MENNNGRGTGIFYGVIGVATLIVTIIGATFAYFSASTNSDVDAIATGGATLTLGFEDTADTYIKQNLVPADETDTGWATRSKIDATTGCVDLNGNNYCSVYQFTVTNTSTSSAQTIYANFKVQTNSFLDANGEAEGTDTNLRYAIFRGSAAEVEAKVTDGKGWSVASSDVISTKVADATNLVGTVQGNKGDLVVPATAIPVGTTYQADLPALTQTLKPGKTMTYTVIMWIHETGSAQNDDQGKAFAAGVNFNTSDGKSGVTAVLSTNS